MYNKLIIIILILVFQIDFGLSQFTPPDLKFDGIKANWKYLSVDKNFIPVDTVPTGTKYSNHLPVAAKIYGDDIYLFESTSTISPFPGEDGSLMHKLDYRTGELKWINYNNGYSGLFNRELYNRYTGYMDVLENGDVEIMGNRDVDYDKDKHVTLFNSTPVRKIIDGKTGDIKEEIYGKDTTKRAELYTGQGGKFMKNSKGENLYVSVKVYMQDSVLKEKIYFWKIKENFDLEAQPFDSVFHDTGIKREIPISFYPLSIPLNKDTLLLVFGNTDPNDNNFPITELKYYYVNISDLDNIRIEKIVDVTEDLLYPAEVWGNQIYIINSGENVFLTQRVWDKTISKSYSWFTWRDKYGNLKARVDPLFADGIYYRYFDIIGIKDDILYMDIRVDDPYNQIFDILKIEPGHNKVQKLKRWEVLESDSLLIFTPDFIFLPENKLFVSLWIEKSFVIGNFHTALTYTYYYNFNLSDFGITFSSNYENIIENRISIYPNPSSNTISLSCEDNPAGYIEIIDRLGRVMYKEKSTGCEEKSIDISGFSQGLYFVRMIDESGRVMGKGKFVKE
jgi:hypothetical protein